MLCSLCVVYVKTHLFCWKTIWQELISPSLLLPHPPFLLRLLFMIALPLSFTSPSPLSTAFCPSYSFRSFCICSLPPFLSSCLVPLPPTSFTSPRLPPTLPPPLPAPLLLTPSSPFLILPAPTSFCSALSLLHHVEHTHTPPLLSCFSPPPPPSIITHSLSTSPLSLFLSHLFQLSILLLSFSPSPCPPSFLLFLLPLF